MIPLYGFLKGDTLGLVIVGYENETVRSLAQKLQQAADVRVAKTDRFRVVYKNQSVDLDRKLSQVGFGVLDRFDVVPEDADEL